MLRTAEKNEFLHIEWGNALYTSDKNVHRISTTGEISSLLFQISCECICKHMVATRIYITHISPHKSLCTHAYIYLYRVRLHINTYVSWYTRFTVCTQYSLLLVFSHWPIPFEGNFIVYFKNITYKRITSNTRKCIQTFNKLFGWHHTLSRTYAIQSYTEFIVNRTVLCL